MLKGLRTVVYHVTDLQAAKQWLAEVFDVQPYFDEPFYVGFNIGGYELGLDPDPSAYNKGNQSITYWGVDNIEHVMEHLRNKRVNIHQEVQEVGEGIKVASILDPFDNVIGLIENPHFKIQ